MPSYEPTDSQDSEYRAFLANGQLKLQQCSSCGHIRPPAPWICPECLSTDWFWCDSPGHGQIEGLVWYMQPVDKRFADVPYSVALVKLDEGPRLIGNIVETAFGDVAVGQRVEPVFGTGYADRPVVNFRPVRGETQR